MTLQPIRTCPEPTNMVALAAYQVGFVPQESLVVLFMAPGEQPHQGVVDLSAKVDLAAGTRQLPAFCKTHVPPGGHFIAVIFSQEPRSDQVEDFVRTLAFASMGLEPDLPVFVATDEYVVAVAIEPDCGRMVEVSERVPETQVWHSPAATQCVLAGQMVADSAQECLDQWVLPSQSADDQQLWAQEFAAAVDHVDQVAWLIETWQQQWDGAGGQSQRARARFAAAMTNSWFRDVVLVAAMYGFDRVDVAQLLTHPTAMTDLLDAAFSSGSSVRPQPERLAAIRQVLTSLTPWAQGPARTAVLSVLAFIAWWSGDGGQARRVLGHIEHPQEYRLAALLSQALQQSAAPGWWESTV